MPAATQDPWQSFRADLAHSAILTDFDGTLSQVVADPGDARPIDGVVETLAALATRAHTVAVISGRPLAFLVRHFPDPVTLSGLYGLQTRRDGCIHEHPEVAPWRDVIEATVAAATRELPDDVRVEPKGFALTLHYRTAPHRREVIEQWADQQAARTGLVVQRARCSVELNLPISVDKGTVVAGFAGAPGSVTRATWATTGPISRRSRCSPSCAEVGSTRRRSRCAVRRRPRR